MEKREHIQFLSAGNICRGWLYKPGGSGKRACVVLAHGFSGVKEMRLDAYAERFVRAGYAALVFDYRHFGSSDGTPRQLLSIRRQHQDWHAAIGYARSLPDVDPEKIILWGSSFSGGHVLCVAVEDKKIAAVISQVPHMDGLATSLASGLINNLRLSISAFRDLFRMVRGKKPFYIPAFGRPGDMAAMTAAGEYEASRKLFPEKTSPDETSPDETVAARILLTMPGYSPARLASRLNAPLLVQVGSKDVTTPPRPAIRASQKAPYGEYIIYDCGHFDVYTGPGFERVIGDQLDFLNRQVPPTSSQTPVR